MSPGSARTAASALVVVLSGCSEFVVDPSGRIEFGVVDYLDVATREVQVVNIGSTSGRVVDVSLEDSIDLGLEWKGEPTLVQPDEGLDVTLTYRPSVRPSVDTHLLVEVSSSDEPLRVRVTGLTNLEPDMQVLLNGAEAYAWQAGLTAARLSLEVSNAAFSPLEVGQLTITGSGADHFVFAADYVSNTSLEGGIVRGAAIDWLPGDPGEPFEALLNLPSNDPGANPMVIELYGGNVSGPTAVCGGAQEVTALSTVTLDGQGSHDPGAHYPLTYAWTLETPPGSASTLASADTVAPTFTTDLVGSYTATLRVTNALGTPSVSTCSTVVQAVTGEEFRVEMFWAEPYDDMDLHLLRTVSAVTGTPDDCYYLNCDDQDLLDWWGDSDPTNDPHLDLDDIDGTGPENINIADPEPSTYVVVVHDYQSANATFPDANLVTVQLYLHGVPAAPIPFELTGEDAWYTVARILWPEGTVTLCGGLPGC